jgi:hypothetical protein
VFAGDSILMNIEISTHVVGRAHEMVSVKQNLPLHESHAQDGDSEEIRLNRGGREVF